MDVVARKSDIATGKKLYIKMGCRGDWPKLQPPDWQPPDANAAQQADAAPHCGPQGSGAAAQDSANTITVPMT